MVSDQTIYNAIRTGRLKPRDVGLRQFEVRFNAPRDVEPDDPENYCDLVSVIFDDTGRVGSFMHCSDSHTDIPGDDIEGIGGEYADVTNGYGEYQTTSYLSDDKELLARVRSIVEGATP